MDIALEQVGSWQAENREWLGSRDGTDVTQTITLATATFTAGPHFPNGFIPSGTVLGEMTANGATKGMYGPYDNAASDGRQVAVGFLYSSVKVRSGGPNVGAAIHWRGIIKSLKLPFQSGTGSLDSAGRTDLAAKFWIW